MSIKTTTTTPSWAPFQYPIRRLAVRSRKVSKPRDLYLELSDRSEIWQAPRQQGCLLSLERLVTLWKEETTGSAFSKRATAILLAVTVAVVLELSYGIVHGLGHVTMRIYRGVNYSTFVPRAEPVFIIIDEIEGFIILVLTVFLIGRLCKTRCCGEGKYPMDKVIPVIVGNVFYIFAAGMKASMNDIVPWLYLAIVIIILLVWLLGESDLRQPLQETCCPCCSSREDEENETILLEWCGVLEVN